MSQTSRLKEDGSDFKAVMYNFVENGKTYVRMELYIDDDVTDSLLMATWL
jgi:hypothetical protein